MLQHQGPQTDLPRQSLNLDHGYTNFPTNKHRVDQRHQAAKQTKSKRNGNNQNKDQTQPKSTPVRHDRQRVYWVGVYKGVGALL